MSSFRAAIHTLPNAVNNHPLLPYLGRHCSTQILLANDYGEHHLEIHKGHLAPIIDGPNRMRAWQFALRAPLTSWHEFWQPIPKVGFNDIFAMVRYGHAQIDGDIGPLLEHLRFVKDIVALPRGTDLALRP